MISSKEEGASCSMDQSNKPSKDFHDSWLISRSFNNFLFPVMFNSVLLFICVFFKVLKYDSNIQTNIIPKISFSTVVATRFFFSNGWFIHLKPQAVPMDFAHGNAQGSLIDLCCSFGAIAFCTPVIGRKKSTKWCFKFFCLDLRGICFGIWICKWCFFHNPVALKSKFVQVGASNWSICFRKCCKSHSTRGPGSTGHKKQCTRFRSSASQPEMIVWLGWVCLFLENHGHIYTPFSHQAPAFSRTFFTMLIGVLAYDKLNEFVYMCVASICQRNRLTVELFSHLVVCKQ